MIPTYNARADYLEETLRILQQGPGGADAYINWPENGATNHWAFVGRLEPEHKGIDLLLRALAGGVGKRVTLNLGRLN